MIHDQSSLSARCKQSVHVNEITRRILNNSSRLDWKDQTAPILTDHMVRMKEGGYDEKYRKLVLEKALKNYDRMMKDSENGRRPINRPKDWQKEERMKEKRRKKHTWATKGGSIAPHQIPSCCKC